MRTKIRTALTTVYAAGLRASEAVGLKVGDIDSGRGVVRIEHGKGGKDRTVMLGHNNLSSTALYTKVSNDLIRRTTSPLDRLNIEVVLHCERQYS